jgi:hypothetical protein
MALRTPKDGLKAIAKAKWEAEQAAKAAATAAKAAEFAASVAK